MRTFKAELLTIMLTGLNFCFAIFLLLDIAPELEYLFNVCNTAPPIGSQLVFFLSHCLRESLYISIPFMCLSFFYIMNKIVPPNLKARKTHKEQKSNRLSLSPLSATCIGLLLFNILSFLQLIVPILKKVHYAWSL
jgi:type II secretory pathway component PulF